MVTVKFYLAELSLQVTTWMNLGNLTVSEKRQSQVIMYSMILFFKVKKRGKSTTYYSGIQIYVTLSKSDKGTIKTKLRIVATSEGRQGNKTGKQHACRCM